MTRHTDHRPATGRPAKPAVGPDLPLATKTAAERWCHPMVVAGTVLLIATAGAVAYAGGRAAAAVLYCLLLDGGVVVGWLAAAAGWGVWPTARLARRYPPALAGVTAVATGLGIVGLLVLGLGLAGWLNAVTAYALLGVGWVLGGARLARLWKAAEVAGSPPADAITPPPPPPFGADSPAWRWLWLLVAPPLAAALVAAMFPPGMLWKPEEPHGFDATAYHLQVPREWFEAGRIVPLTHNAFSYFPFGVEVHSLLAMHLKGGPWDAMYLAQLMHLAWIGLSVAAVYGVARALSADRRSATVAAVAYATVPFLAQLGPLAFNEGGLLLYGTLAVGWTLVGMQKDECRRMNGDRNERDAVGATADGTAERAGAGLGSDPSFPYLLGGAMAGLACGVKLTGVPLFLLAVPAAAFLVRVRRAPMPAFRAAVAFVLAGSVVFAPWLVRTAVWTGNPVFPEGTAIFGKAHFTDAQVERWKRAHAAQPDQQSAGARLAAFGGQVLGNWQFGYLLLPAGVAAAVVLARRRPEARLLGLLLAAHAAFWLVVTHLQGRFFTPALPLAAIAVAGVPWGRVAGGRSTSASPAPSSSQSTSMARFGPAAWVAGVAVAAVGGWWGVHARVAGALANLKTDSGPDARAAILAGENIDWLELDLWDVFPKDDPSATLTLVGDAQVFWYTLPMSRLRYRTPFDVPQGPEATVVEGYAARPADRDGKTWLRVAPAEVDRFVTTYQPFPTVPPAVKAQAFWSAVPASPVVLPPGRELGGRKAEPRAPR